MSSVQSSIYSDNDTGSPPRQRMANNSVETNTKSIVSVDELLALVATQLTRESEVAKLRRQQRLNQKHQSLRPLHDDNTGAYNRIFMSRIS